MTDTPPSATPMPVPPVATVTNPAAPFPPAAPPLPVFVPPSVMDPVSNLDFLPVDDAFALEFRSETIEQLVGGDALRRGVSERIEAGRSHTNADLVAGRDRVRVHATLHEHTGHGLAEVAAHLHTTVEGTLDVHAGNEDTVLLAGHMHDLWDGGAAIVAAMTDDTAAGGGIRVTAPLDLWMHGLMGVEERIGTCTADAVLMESSATHYEREYGPGVHAAGLAVYTGSLYQSSRSSFRPLMRVSSGVRNLIAGGDGGGGGGDAGAGSALAASPPPVPARTGAAEESASGTLAAGRRAVEAPATPPGSADALTDARGVSLEALLDSVDARATEETGEAGIAMRAEDLPELTRSPGTAEQLSALRETLRMDAAESGSETAGGFRASEFEGAVSTHPASGGGGPLEITPPSAVYGKNAPTVRPQPGAPWNQGPEMTFSLLGGADRPPQPAAPKSDFLATYRTLRELRIQYKYLSKSDVARDFFFALRRVWDTVVHEFQSFGGPVEGHGSGPLGTITADRAYLALQEMAPQADRDRDLKRAGAIREALDRIDRLAAAELQALCTKHVIAYAPSTQAMQRPPATVRPTATVAVIPPVTVMPPVTGGATQAPVGSLDQGSTGHITHVPGVPGRPQASTLPGPSVAEATGALASDLGRSRLDAPATVSGTTAAHRAITTTIIEPLLAETFPFWPQPVDPRAAVSGTTAARRAITTTTGTPLLDATFSYWLQVVPVPGSAPFDSGVRHAGETVRPPRVTTTASSTAPGARYLVPSRVDDRHVTNALITGNLPPGFDASGLIAKAREYPEFGLAEQLAARQLPIQTIDNLIDGYLNTSEGGSKSEYIKHLRSMRESIDRALRDAYPGQVGRHWLFQLREINRLIQRSERAAPLLAGAPPRWPPGFGRATSGADELPFPHRQEIAHRFSTDEALLEANLIVHDGADIELGWPIRRMRTVLNDLYRLNAIALTDPAAAAALVDIDWSAIDALMRFVEAPPPAP